MKPALARAHHDSAHRPAISLDLLATKHLRSVQRIDTKVYSKPWSLGLLRQEMSQPDRFHVVATRGGRTIGHAGLMTVVDEGHITTVAVDPAHQGNRIASCLLFALCDRGRQLGSHALTLEVRVGNQGAQALYRRFGFAPAGIRKQYYADTGEDGLVMWAGDIGSADFTERLTRIGADLPAVTMAPALQRVLDQARTQECEHP